MSPSKSFIGCVQASVFNPLILCEQEPHIPSLQDLRKDKLGSKSDLIFINASKTIGPHSSRFNSNVSSLGLSPVSGS